MTLNYTTYVEQLANLMVIVSTNAKFTTFLPGAIDYAEQRIYRELDVLNSRVVDNSGTFQANQENFTLPTALGTFITVESMNAMVGGVRSPMFPVSKDFIYSVYPSLTTATGVPTYFAPVSNTLYLVAPAADQAYTAEVIGTQRPAPLSSANSSTFLTQYCPDLFMAATMVFAMGYERDWGAMSDDPKSALSWEEQYNKLMASAKDEQLRARFEGSAWTAMAPGQPRT